MVFMENYKGEMKERVDKSKPHNSIDQAISKSQRNVHTSQRAASQLSFHSTRSHKSIRICAPCHRQIFLCQGKQANIKPMLYQKMIQ
jgi:hypothetical protein